MKGDEGSEVPQQPSPTNYEEIKNSSLHYTLDTPSDKKTGSSLPVFRVSFRGAVITTILVVVMVVWVGMFLPLMLVTVEVRAKGCQACEKQIATQQTLIHFLTNRTTSDYGTLVLEELLVTVRQWVRNPANEAVDALWGTMQTWHSFNSSWVGAGDCEQRNSVAYYSLKLLLEQWKRVPRKVDYEMYAEPHADRLYVAFNDSNAFAGIRINIEPDPDASKNCTYCWRRAEYFTNADGKTLHIERVENPEAMPVGPVVHREENYTPSERPYFSAQNILVQAWKEQAELNATKAKEMPLKRAWSQIYKFVDGQVGLSWTAPIAYCGNYSCVQGIVSSDVMLKYVSVALIERWEKLQRNEDMKAPIGYSNSSLFIVNQRSRHFPKQNGMLVATSNRYLSVKTLNLSNESTDPVVGPASRALLDCFGSWSAPQLRKPGTLSLKVASDKCEHCTHDIPTTESKCKIVQWLPSPLDSHNNSLWLMVLVLPGQAFARKAQRSMQQTLENFAIIENESRHHTWEVLRLGLCMLAVVACVGTMVGTILGCVVERPLQRLDALLRDMVNLDFSDGGGELASWQAGETSQIRDVAKLQRAFCSLSRGTEAFSRFVPDAVVRHIVSGDRKRATMVHVSRRTVTIMFSIIKDAHQLSEWLPERDEFLHVLKRYFSVMTSVVELYEGVVGEIMTEPPGLLVFWNTPLSVEDHECKACAAALAQQHAIRVLNAEFAQGGLCQVQLGAHIGIHTGVVRTGNIGSAKKMKFGCLGDPMNLASRLAGLCKMYGVGTICSAATHNPLPDLFVSRKLDLVKVKGRMEPTTIYEVIGRICPQAYPSDEDFFSDSDLESGRRPNIKTSESEWDDQEYLPNTSSLSEDERERQITRLQRLPPTTFAVAKAVQMSRESVARNKSGLGKRKMTVTMMPWRFFQVRGRCPNLAAHHSLIGLDSVLGYDSSTEITDAQRSFASRYEAALSAFQRGDFAEARMLTFELLKENPEDCASVNLYGRAGKYLGPDGEVVGLTEEELKSWTGVLNMVGK